MCWNAQEAFRNTGLDHDAANPLTIPATVTIIHSVSSLARSLAPTLRHYACGVHPCLLVPSGRPLPLPQLLGRGKRVCSLFHCATTHEACIPVCLCRAASPSLSTIILTGSTEERQTKQCAELLYRGLVGLEHIYLQHMRACAHRVHATRACLHGHACTSLHMRQPGCSFCKLVGRHTT